MFRTLLLLSLLLMTVTAQAGEAEYYIGPRSGADIYASPSSEARKVAHLDRLIVVRVTEKQRTWWHIETAAHKPAVSGWVYAGAIRQRYQPSTASRKSSSFFSSFGSLFGYGQSSSHEKTAVLGVRGLEDDQATAKGGGSSRQTASAVKWMEGLKVPQQEVDQFIREGDLNP